MRYSNGERVSVSDLVLTDRGFGQVKGRDALTPEGHVIVDLGEESDWFPVAELTPVGINAHRRPVWVGGGWGWDRVLVWLALLWWGWGLLFAAVHGWLWVIEGVMR